MYKLVFHSYCGMSGIPDEFKNQDDARAAVADALRDARKHGQPLSVLTPGKAWEYLEPEDCAMIPDNAGTLRLHHITYECPECGCSCETRDDMRQCCSEAFSPDYSDSAEIDA